MSGTPGYSQSKSIPLTPRAPRRFENFNAPAPSGLLAIIDLPQVQHLPLHDPPAPTASVLHDAPVAMLFAIFHSPRRAKKHAPIAHGWLREARG